MAFAVFSLLQTIDQILKDDRFPISARGKQQIAFMRERVHSFKEILEKFPRNYSRLERRMRDAANEAEEILQHFMYDKIRLRHRLSRAASAGISIPNSNRKQYDCDELKWVMEEMDSIEGEVMAMKIGGLGFTDSHAPVSKSSSTVVSSAHDNTVVGFDEHLKIIAMLHGGLRTLQIIPIVGMAGIGKTTLARMAYNDPLIQNHFDIRVWVNVSHDCEIKEVLRNLLHAMENFQEKILEQNYDSIVERVYMKLKYRRYLIVLDDVWSIRVWNDLRSAFPNDNIGSRIMLTTRLLDVAYFFSEQVHHMSFMSVDKSWDLLHQKVLKNQALSYDLEKIGKEIVAKCGGLPLVIELIANVLCSMSRTKASWEKIADNINSALYESNDRQFEKIISPSYTHLPHHLRQCFLYMGSFPEGYEIHGSKFIKLWIGEGFVIPSSSKSFEMTAEEYLEDLIDASLVFVKRRNYNGQIKSFSIHNLVREFCKRKAQEENLERRLSIARSDLNCLAKTYGSTIRSIVCFEPSETSLDSLRKLRLLRVLDIVDANVYSLPAQVFELFHLRYLAFGCPMKIPPAISMLHYLQTLIICPRKGSQHCTKDEVYLPLEIWMLPQLRHLISFFDPLPDPEETGFSLQNLQTLSVVKNFRCTRRMLKRIPHLKKLGITLFGDKYAQASQLDNLVYLCELEKLKLTWIGDSLVRLMANPGYPATLKKLTLSGWRLPWEHMMVVGSLPNLQVLKLRNYACQGITWETLEGQFCRLKYLLIDESNIQYWNTESTHFPILRCLAIYRCPSLNEIPDTFGDALCLELIEVGNGNDFLLESAKRIQEEQQSLGNDCLQVRFIHDQETSMDVDDDIDGAKSKF